MRILSPLALCLLLAAGPALAGSDFCDGGGDGPIEPEPPGAPGGGSGLASKADTDPRTSSCEVDMVMSLNGAERGIEYWRMRDLPFTTENWAVLKRSKQWPELPLEFKQISLTPVEEQTAKAGAAAARPAPPIGVPLSGGRSTFLEWSFVPADNKSEISRVLALTVFATDNGPILRADWMIPPRRNWSYADKPATLPSVIESQSAALTDEAQAATLSVSLLHDGDHVRVGVGQPVRQWLSFALPSGQWQPLRLRNGLLLGTPLAEGMGLKVNWPSLRARQLNQDPGDGGGGDARTPTGPRAD
ncbi:hypothetical protein ABIE09_004683 [Lysobacter enzymogenes]|uniref:hypothetical protein n=1 Tax=Lysobacter enzymogenes TaxID=69 RepID=UPI0033915FE1